MTKVTLNEVPSDGIQYGGRVSRSGPAPDKFQMSRISPLYVNIVRNIVSQADTNEPPTESSDRDETIMYVSSTAFDAVQIYIKYPLSKYLLKLMSIISYTFSITTYKI